MPLLLPTLALSTALRLLASPPAAPPVTRFGGHLAHAPAGDTVRLWVGERQVKTPLSPTGDFQFEFTDLRATTPVHFKFARQNTRLYLTPGDQLRLALDFQKFDESLTYSGRGAAVNVSSSDQGRPRTGRGAPSGKQHASDATGACRNRARRTASA